MTGMDTKEGLKSKNKQAGAELYQAQVKLGLAKLAVIRKKLKA